MVPTRTLHFTSGLAFTGGMKKLLRQGLSPEEMLFLAFDRKGDVRLQISRFPDHTVKLRPGHKLALKRPFEQDMFYLDAAHPLNRMVVVINGDRRIGRLPSLVDVGVWMSWFVEKSGTRSVFFGCAPHMPGSWWIHGPDERVVPLHTSGFVDIVVAPDRGLLARRSFEPHLYYLPMADAVAGRLDRWEKIYSSPLGNLLLLERRMVDDRLLLNCRDGLVEVGWEAEGKVVEHGIKRAQCGCAVVGRVAEGTFAVSKGRPVDWGFDALSPATLVGVKECSFDRLTEALRKFSK